MKEISPSRGYQLNKTVYKVGSEATKYTIEYNSAKNDVNEQIFSGRIDIIKHTDDGETGIETPEAGAKFEVYLKSAGSYKNAKERERDILICDEDGFAETKRLPYGTYVVHQISGWENSEFVKDFDVIISGTKETYKYLINNKEFESYLKMVKVDAKTGKIVNLSNATFSLYKLNENTKQWEQVSCKVGNEYHTSWKTNNTGVAYTETKLKAGQYKIEELVVPQGFLQLNKEITFEINRNNETLEYDDDYDAFITITVKNEQPTGTLILDKTVAIRQDVDTSLVDISDLSKIEFKLAAKENIIDHADGKIIYKKGQIINTYNLSKNGNLKITDLPMGKYQIYETKTLDGLVLNSKKYEVNFTQTDLVTKVYEEKLDITNDTTIVEFSKTDITGEKELPGAKLSVIDKNEKIIDSWISTEQSHKIEGLLVGNTYTLCEEISPENYVKATNIKFTVENTSNIQKVNMIDKVVEVSKQDIGGNEIEGAHLKVVDENQKTVDEWISTKEPHKVKGLEENKTYVLYEDYASEGYVISNSIQFTVTSDKKTQVVKMIDKVVEVSKEDVGGNEIEGAHLKVVDENEKIVDEWISTTKPHKVKGLKEDKTYVLYEDYAHEGYVISNCIKFTVTSDKKTQVIKMVDKQLKAIKTDVDGNAIEGATLTVISTKTKNIVDKWVSEKTPHAVSGLVENQSYILHEEIVVDGYVKAKDVQFTVTPEKELQEVVMVDKVLSVSKTDLVTGKELPGAELEITDKAGNIIDIWTSTTEPHNVNGLEEGQEYTLTEKTCPYGFEEHVSWCACYVSWCANECGYIEKGIMPKFSACTDGITWFKDKNQWHDRGDSYYPIIGDIIFFDWIDENGNQDGTSDHVGIVTRTDMSNRTIYTIEGNTDNKCAERIYSFDDVQVMGYGSPKYQ